MRIFVIFWSASASIYIVAFRQTCSASQKCTRPLTCTIRVFYMDHKNELFCLFLFVFCFNHLNTDILPYLKPVWQKNILYLDFLPNVSLAAAMVIFRGTCYLFDIDQSLQIIVLILPYLHLLIYVFTLYFSWIEYILTRILVAPFQLRCGCSWSILR